MLTHEAVDEVIESYRGRTICKLMLARATNEESAVSSMEVLTARERGHITILVVQQVIAIHDDKVYLTLRGKLQANSMLKLVADHIYEES